MSDVISGKNMTVIVLDEDEADYLAMILHGMMTEEGRVLVDEGPLYDLYNALVPAEDDNG